MINKILVVFSTIFLISFTGSAFATTITYNDFSSVSGLTLNGATAGLNPNGDDVLRLTAGLGQSGSAFSTSTINLNDTSFSTKFAFRITNPMGISDSDGQGADGLVFVVQTVANNVGGSGGGIGYAGISNSVGIEFDTWNNGSWDDNSGNHVGINLDGDINSVLQTDVSPRLNNGADWFSWVDYNGLTNLLQVRLATVDLRPTDALLSYTVDLATVLETTDAFVGFTSGTGSAGGYHDILSWEFRDTYNPINNPVPEPSTCLLFGLGVGVLALYRKRSSK